MRLDTFALALTSLGFMLVGAMLWIRPWVDDYRDIED